MKKFAKLLALVMVFAVMIGMGTFAFAADDANNLYTDDGIIINKTYTLIGNGVSPEETFTIEIGDGELVDGRDSDDPTDGVPTVSTSATVDYDEGGATTAGNKQPFSAITVSNVTKIGVYEYPVTEIAGDNAGVVYDSEEYTLRIVVVNADPDDVGDVVIAGAYLVKGEEKTDTIENTYSSGTFEVTKIVKGDMGDPEKYFDVTVTFTAEEGTLGSGITYSGGMYDEDVAVDDSGVAEIQVKHGDTVTFANVPDGVTWEVEEAEYDDYTTTYSAAEGTITADGENACEITNTCNTTPPTGIDLDSVPYIVMLAVVALGVVAFVAKKRSVR